MAKKSAKSKGFRKQNVKKPYLSKKEIGILCAVVVLLAIGAFFLFRYDDGALKVRDGAVVTGGDNWLVVNGSNTRGGYRYYKLAEVNEIDGFSREKSALSTDANLAEYIFTAEGEGEDTHIDISCAHNPAKAMAEYTRTMLGDIDGTEIGEVQTAELSGRPTYYYIYSAKPAEATGEADEAAAEADEATAEADEKADAADEDTNRFTRALSAYVEASDNNCVILHVKSRADTAEGCLSDEALTALAEKAVLAVAIEEGK